MIESNRRAFLAGTAAVGATVLGGELLTPAPATAAGATAPRGDVITARDPRYADLTTGNNQRFVARPDYVKMIRSTPDAVRAVQDAVDSGKRVSVRSGGHCFSDFVCNDQVEVILDLSELVAVGYDPALRAFFVDPGARLMNVYESLYKGWGVTVPGGICYSVGAGGHIAGGGYGLLSRAHGLVVDHLYAVEVVVVDRAGRARAVRATREADDPNRDLWWAHTGGGGGNFGVVTRYWFRSPGAKGSEPSAQLLAAPSEVLVSAVEFPWDQLDESKFVRLVRNFGEWHARNSAPDSPYAPLSSLFNVSHRAHGSLGMFTQIDAAVPRAAELLDDYLRAITAGVDVTPQPAVRPMGELPALPDFVKPRRLPWLQATRLVGTNNPTITNPTSRGVHKSAYMKQNFTDAQARTLFRHMTRDDFHNPDTMLVLFSFGGKVNAVDTHATANAQRGSIFKMCFQTFWPDPADDAFYVGWARDIYQEFFATTGGVPVPGDAYEGCYINYPDNDVADPAHNSSGVPWPLLYYRGNYPRLQRAKRRWDPRNIFRHALSIQP
ncbi:FAD/FMN-containing dehydrogenase [Krasilnikovia cinnamomea]|uniref:FAD/FMN-containing dehydrogenase n=1 Tax=Krasilnikovia cinnamomea TaxID=349313 RepID=A0A4Q7ZTC1_9ACTN|nr:BBE domain-containing protein [Krasilnikovia cinnamomea]RZU53779.1 FAD/FMN-containing dehydrogenase [Krasilnikovia cinnamomea]